MKLIKFQYTNQYDNPSPVYVNPVYVVTVRPEGKTQTTIDLGDGSITVDGTIDVVSQQLCSDDQAEESTAALDKMPDSG